MKNKLLLTTMLIAGATGSHATEAEIHAALTGRDKLTTVAHAAEVGRAITTISGTAHGGLGQTQLTAVPITAAVNAELQQILNVLLGLTASDGATADGSAVPMAGLSLAGGTAPDSNADNQASVDFLGAAGTQTIQTGTTFISIPAVAYTVAGLTVPSGAAHTGLTAEALARLLSHSSVRVAVAA